MDVQGEIMEHIRELKADRILLVTDETVDELHGDYFLPLMSTSGTGESFASEDSVTGLPKQAVPVEKFILPCGDAAKSWEHLTELMQWTFKIGATKKSVVVAFGGGALLNITGLFASIAYRGMKLVYVPTTLLAMHDVVTSLKTSICFDGRKNNIGSFYPPLKSLVDAGFCRTLPRSEFFSGLGELAKNAALLGGKHAEGFKEALSKDAIDAQNGGSGEEFSLSDASILKLVRLGIQAKMDVLRDDAYEKTSGMIFEYGHTMSHALEKTYGDGIVPHGLGVTYGMLACSYAAEKLGIMSKANREGHDAICNLLIQRWPLPEPLPSIEEVMARAMRDSKRGITGEAEDEISDVLLRDVGDVLPSKTSNLNKFPCALFADWLASMGFAKSTSVDIASEAVGN
jgi:3-dehydroquinate synthase/2-deoxy-scyllo-inosose synthase